MASKREEAEARGRGGKGRVCQSDRSPRRSRRILGEASSDVAAGLGQNVSVEADLGETDFTEGEGHAVSVEVDVGQDPVGTEEVGQFGQGSEVVEVGEGHGSGQANYENTHSCMGYSFTVESEYEESDYLQELAEDSDGGVEHGPRFNPRIDMQDPTFSIGMVFESFDMLKHAIRLYAVKNRYLIDINKNDKQRVSASCAKECPWTLYAASYKGVEGVQIKTLVDRHTCVKGFRNKFATYLWVADAYYDVMRLNPETKVGQLVNYVQRDYNIIVNRAKVAKGRRHALKMLRGDEKEQYARLSDYAEELGSTNLTSTCILSLDNLVFKKIFVCLAPCRKGFIRGCRPVICLDGCFLKGRYGRQILAAVGVDPNDGIWPIAYAIVDVECRASWSWFLELLGGDLVIENSHAWTFMSDRQKVV